MGQRQCPLPAGLRLRRCFGAMAVGPSPCLARLCAAMARRRPRGSPLRFPCGAAPRPRPRPPGCPRWAPARPAPRPRPRCPRAAPLCPCATPRAPWGSSRTPRTPRSCACSPPPPPSAFPPLPLRGKAAAPHGGAARRPVGRPPRACSLPRCGPTRTPRRCPPPGLSTCGGSAFLRGLLSGGEPVPFFPSLLLVASLSPFPSPPLPLTLRKWTLGCP